MADVMDDAPVPVLPDIRDEDEQINSSFAAIVSEALGQGDAARLKTIIEDLHEADVADLMEALAPEERPRFIALLGSDFDYTVLTELDDAVREDLLEEIPNEAIAEGVRDLDSDDAVYIIEDLAEEDQEEVLAHLPALERVAVERSLDYDEGTAGRLMQADFIAIPHYWTVGQTIDFCRDSTDLPDRFYELFIVDPAHALIGTVPLDRLLRGQRSEAIETLADEPEHKIHAADEASNAALLFQRYNLVSAPVLDEGERLVGVLTIDDVVDVISEEADADIKALGGVKEDEELSDSFLDIVKSRFPWLLANLVTAILASLVIGMFENSISKMVALAVLMPIVASMGGNAGTQTMTVTVRALAMRELSRANTWRVIGRELAVGASNGLAFALIMGAVAAFWFGPLEIGIVIGLAFICVLTAAALGGILIPLTLNRLGVDPAVSSGPFVTTVTDVVGFFAFLGIATLWFSL